MEGLKVEKKISVNYLLWDFQMMLVFKHVS